MIDSLTLDQIRIFLAVADTGSFSKAAKQLNRAQSAVTYGIQKLEAQFGIALFDRTAYRPALTEAGRALLPRARRIAEETNAFRDTARSLASGLEAELTIVLDSMFPLRAVVEALRAFTAKFPTVTPRIYVQSLGAAAELVLDGTCMIGLLPLYFSDMALLKRFPLLTVDLIPVAAPDHPLAALDGARLRRVVEPHVAPGGSRCKARDAAGGSWLGQHAFSSGPKRCRARTTQGHSTHGVRLENCPTRDVRRLPRRPSAGSRRRVACRTFVGRCRRLGHERVHLTVSLIGISRPPRGSPTRALTG
jgi:DNA-binding transcriptional LysR family regulator